MQFRGYTESFPDHPRTLPHGRTDRQSHFRTPRHGAVRRPSPASAWWTAVLARLGVSRRRCIALTELEKEGLLERLACAPSRWTRSATRWTCAGVAGAGGCWPSAAPRPRCWRSWSRRWKKAASRWRRRGWIRTPRWTRAPGARSTGAFTKSCARPPATRAAVGAGQQQDAAGRPAALTLPSTPHCWKRLRAARAQAEDLLRAITRREAVRAENLMRETPTAAARTSACC